MGFSVDTTGYVHTYEAYRVPKGTTVKNAAGEDVILSKDEDTLVLTEAASRQLVKDRRDYGSALQAKAEIAAQKTQEEAAKKHAQDQAKAIPHQLASLLFLLYCGNSNNINYCIFFASTLFAGNNILNFYR